LELFYLNQKPPGKKWTTRRDEFCKEKIWGCGGRGVPEDGGVEVALRKRNTLHGLLNGGPGNLPWCDRWPYDSATAMGPPHVGTSSGSFVAAAPHPLPLFAFTLQQDCRPYIRTNSCQNIKSHMSLLYRTQLRIIVKSSKLTYKPRLDIIFINTCIKQGLTKDFRNFSDGSVSIQTKLIVWFKRDTRVRSLLFAVLTNNKRCISIYVICTGHGRKKSSFSRCITSDDTSTYKKTAIRLVSLCSYSISRYSQYE
jgi:hypothetical protein